MPIGSVFMMKSFVSTLLALLFALPALAETPEGDELALSEEAWYEEIDWDPFDGKGFTPRYAYLDFDNFIGYAHYYGLSYYQKAGAESEGVTARVADGTMGKKYNLSYSNAFSFMAVDFGLSYYDLASDNFRNLSDEELLGLELGLRFWVVQLVAVHTENTSFVTFGYGF